MMKSVVRSNTESETKIAMDKWEDMYKKHGLSYVEPHMRKPKMIEIVKQPETELVSERDKILNEP